MELLARTVRSVASTDDLALPGDYVKTSHLETGGKVCTGIVMNCPFCGMANAITITPPTFWQRVASLFRRGGMLSLDDVIACYAKPAAHRFSVRNGFIIPARAT